MNIFVSNISFKVREDALTQLFSSYGSVISARIIRNKETKRSKGFGFVEMADDNEAQKAIDALNGTTHFERPITVSQAKPRSTEDQGNQ